MGVTRIKLIPLAFIIACILFSMPALASPGVVELKFDKQTVVAPEKQILTLYISKTLYKITDAKISLEVLGPAYFTETKNNKLQREYQEEIDTKEEEIEITLDEKYTGTTATVLVKYYILYHTNNPFQSVWEENGSAQFDAVWSDKAVCQDRLDACEADLENQKSIISDLRGQISSCESEKSGCIVEKMELEKNNEEFKTTITNLESKNDKLEEQLKIKQTECDIDCNFYGFPAVAWIFLILVIGVGIGILLNTLKVAKRQSHHQQPPPTQHRYP